MKLVLVISLICSSLGDTKPSDGNNTEVNSKVKRKAYIVNGGREACYEYVDDVKSDGYCRMWLPDRKVPYDYSGSVSQMSSNIRKVANAINTDSCLHMYQDNLSWNTGKYGLIYDTGNGCLSNIGKKYYYKRPQKVTLAPLCNSYSLILHETLHALGMMHEQTRPDRDAYVRPLLYNARQDAHSNWDKETADSVSTMLPYDYDSIMHYSRTAFTISGKDTMQHVQPEMERKNMNFGSATDLTHYDKMWLNWMYKCADHCDQKECFFHGFVDKNCQCVCPEFLRGARCDTVTTGCGRTVYIEPGSSVTITSPNYPNKYGNQLKCAWALRSDASTYLEYELLDFQLANHKAESWDKDPCANFDYLEVRFYALPVSGPKYCGREISPGKRWRSTYNHGMLVFKSDLSFIEKGFKMKISAIDTLTCDDNPCTNGGICRTGSNNHYYCLCPTGYSGAKCQYGSTPAPQPTSQPTPQPNPSPPGPVCEDDPKYSAKCGPWMEKGECTKNRWMLTHCKKSCGLCRHECFDGHLSCEGWQKMGECSKNQWMKIHCKKSCGICSPPCYDENDMCSAWASKGECEKNPGWMLLHCQQSCNLCTAIRRLIMSDTPVCQDDHEDCEKWALLDDCIKNPDYMRLKCPKSCGHCDCVDDEQDCATRTENGECTNNSLYMKVKCRKSCGLCCADRTQQDQCCADRDARCPGWAQQDFCGQTDVGVNTSQCRKSCRLCQE